MQPVSKDILNGEFSPLFFIMDKKRYFLYGVELTPFQNNKLSSQEKFQYECATFAKILDNYQAKKNGLLFIKISLTSLLNSQFYLFLEKMRKEGKLKESLVLETEVSNDSLESENIKEIIDTKRKLRSYRIKFSLVLNQVNQNSLRMINQIRPNYIKIDYKNTLEEYNDTLTEDFAKLSKYSHLIMVGIDSRNALNLSLNYGITLGQGSYLSH